MSDFAETPGTSVQDEGESGFIRHLPSIMWQRRWLIALPSALGLAAGVAAAYLIPPQYRSEATLIIETQQLPTDVVASPVDDLIDQRIARVRERVLSRPDLIQLIRSLNLYPEDSNKPLSSIIERMRKATHIAPIDANVTGGGNSTIAFSISYDYPEPFPAQQVVQQYVNSFLDLDAKTRSESAAGAAAFLGDQAAQLQKQINAIEGQVTSIKSAKGGMLALADQQTTGNPALDAARIDGDIAELQAENARLASMPNPNTDDADVRAAEAALRVARARYSDTHPDVIAAEQQLEAAKAAAGKRPAAANPNLLQIQGNNAKIATLRQAKALVLSEGASTRALQAQAPAVAEQVSQLEQRAQQLREQYAVISSKLQTAQVANRMESENKGERLSVGDPPTTPDEPFWPNRKLLIAGGLVAGIGLGLALSLLIELLFRPVRGTDAVRQITGRPPLVVIPMLDRQPSLVVRLLERLSRRRLARRPASAG